MCSDWLRQKKEPKRTWDEVVCDGIDYVYHKAPTWILYFVLALGIFVILKGYWSCLRF